jgi:hypothetical protein
MDSLLRSRTVKIRRGATPSRSSRDQAIVDRLYNQVDHVDAKLTPQVGNPGFIAQFDILAIPKYFTVAAGVYTSVTAAAVFAAQPTLGTQLPVFIFGNSDKAAGFKKMRQQFPLSGWSYDTPFIYGADSGAGTVFGALDATGRAQLQVGDLVIPVTAVLGAVNYVAFSIIRCTQTGYGSLLDATNSDAFTMNMVRYILADSTAASLNQYANQLQPFNLSIFGKFSSDQTSPNSFKIPEQQQQNIIDVPLVLDVDKQVSIGLYMNYDLPTQLQLSFFVAQVVKVAR